jgi:hypothetical protein
VWQNETAECLEINCGDMKNNKITEAPQQPTMSNYSAELLLYANVLKSVPST